MTDTATFEALIWAESFRVTKRPLTKPVAKSAHDLFYDELTHYWRLALLSRQPGKFPVEAEKARKILFRVRTYLERCISDSIEDAMSKGAFDLGHLLEKSIFSSSIKQGLSLRLPLTSCVPTDTCHWGCYAHDGMDAGRYPIIKGSINGVIAKAYESANSVMRASISTMLSRNIEKAVFQALREAENAEFDREPRIRFSHVGEIAAYPDFANEFAKLVSEVSSAKVSCVVYTRHPNVARLDRDLYVINFTLDEDSLDRKSWIPEGVRTVFSAWNGQINKDADVNFLEHHRFSHQIPAGAGLICPVTKPAVKVKTCDAAKCDLCFRKVGGA